MAATYRPSLGLHVGNFLVTTLIRFGIGPRPLQILTVKGRKTGRPYSTPVAILEQNGQRWLVSPYGERPWVKNARVAGQVTLRRGRRSESVLVKEELDPAQSGPVLKRYVSATPITRKYFDAAPQSPVEYFIAEAPRHPVFRILGQSDKKGLVP